MTKPNPPKKNQPCPPRTLRLRLDNRQAWRQGDSAIIIPIVYDLLDSQRDAAKRDTLIIPIALLTPPPPPPLIEVLGPATLTDEALPLREEPETQPAALENEPTLAAVPAFATAHPHPDSLFFTPSGSTFSRAHHLSTAVPLLLLGGIALVFFAWMAFR